MKRYDPFYDGRRSSLEESEHGECLKRDEVIEALLGLKTWAPDSDRFGPCVSRDDTGVLVFFDECISALGISSEEWHDALSERAESAEHERKHREDPEPAEYRGDR